MTDHERDLDIARKDGWAASKAGKNRSTCHLTVPYMREAWMGGFGAERADRAQKRREKRRKFIQRYNPSTKKWERYSKVKQKIVSTRKKKYCCQEGNW